MFLDSAIVNDVYWSEALNKVFVDNFERDPSLIWQYFGSAKGFFRQYPGIKWKPDEHGVIAFDCRNRKWYIQAATSPKDVVILVDVSGSMKGLRLTIARQTVSSILDTLGDDDFFNIIAWVAGKLVPISSSLWARGGVHPGQVASPSQGNTQTTIHTLIHTPKGNLE
ncbi:Voltage-dependent calcium channel subunit alpha-2/delta-3 [Ilyodon furcidens]|uniref:Voltage-dependent calcium channel subunit alpha-2/delta-3 n=1 Tax=Ilyodon furcidens TaxID=33524 RepID=A0ABV0VDL2_9TELE